MTGKRDSYPVRSGPPDSAIARTQARMQQLREDTGDFIAAREQIPTGFDRWPLIRARQQKIMAALGADEKQWADYRWQLANRFTTAESLRPYLKLNDLDVARIADVARQYRFAVSPYYLSLIDPDDPACPIRRQAVPDPAELDGEGELDPMDEAGSSPVPCVTRRYPDRLIVKVTNQCGMYCRFCQRRRLIGEQDHHTPPDQLRLAVEYIRRNPEIRDVLLTGGDALLLSDNALDSLLGELRRIPHVEIIRLGTRTPVTLPQRVTPELVSILSKYHPLFVNTHFNSPAEITPSSLEACNRLANAGMPLGNQMVLLRGVNDDPFTVRRLNQELLRLRVRPYYIFHPKHVKGTAHFQVRIETGMEIMEQLRGHTSGLAVPTYIVNGPGGLGKTPLLPNYLLYLGSGHAVFRNWQGRIFEIDNS